MSYHYDISLDSYDSPSPSSVRFNDPLAESGVFDIWKVHGAEHCGLKTLSVRVVEILEIRNGLLLLVLDI
jgi:hypothetical protein